LASGKKLGEIFVGKGALALCTVERMLVISRQHNKRFGTAREDMGLVTGEKLAEALAYQYDLSLLRDITTLDYSVEILSIITAETAAQSHLSPQY